MTVRAVQRPRPVRPGATIGVVAPAGPVPPEELEAGLQRLQSWGYRAVVGDAVLSRRGYLAGTDAERAADFNRVWADPAVNAVICARGGYGAMIVALLGTPWEPDFTGRIVLLEDVDEAPYRIDRMLVQLLLAGKLQRAAGILIGDSPTCLQGPPNRPSLTLPEVLVELLGPLGIPVLYGFPCGHGSHRATLPLGVRARLDAEAPALTILEPAVEA